MCVCVCVCVCVLACVLLLGYICSSVKTGLLAVYKFRVPEVIFQPPMVGVDQGGVSQTIDYVLHYYLQQRLVQVS